MSNSNFFKIKNSNGTVYSVNFNFNSNFAIKYNSTSQFCNGYTMIPRRRLVRKKKRKLPLSRHKPKQMCVRYKTTKQMFNKVQAQCKYVLESDAIM